jgi:hypothetical protein
VSAAEGTEFAYSITSKFIETNVMSSINLDKLFHEIAELRGMLSVVWDGQASVENVDLEIIVARNQSGGCIC